MDCWIALQHKWSRRGGRGGEEGGGRKGEADRAAGRASETGGEVRMRREDGNSVRS